MSSRSWRNPCIPKTCCRNCRDSDSTSPKSGRTETLQSLFLTIKKENRAHVSGPGLERRVEMRLHRNRREPERECKMAQFWVCDAPTSHGSKIRERGMDAGERSNCGANVYVRRPVIDVACKSLTDNACSPGPIAARSSAAIPRESNFCTSAESRFGRA